MTTVKDDWQDRVHPYRTQSVDTSEEAERFQIALLRRAGPAKRFRLARSLAATTRQLSWATLRRLRPEGSVLQAGLAYVELVYGPELAQALAQHFAPGSDYRLLQSQQSLQSLKSQQSQDEVNIMISHDVVEAIRPVIAFFEQMGVTYVIGGSVASSILGIPRSTNDADLVAALRLEHVGPLVQAFGPDQYYLSEPAIVQAVLNHSSFNLIHLATMLKVDIFVPAGTPFEQNVFARSGRSPLLEDEGDGSLLVNLYSPEDLVLRKLDWYRAGGETSEKQWLDVLGILKLQGPKLDQTYLQLWAIQLGVNDLLATVLNEAGL